MSKTKILIAISALILSALACHALIPTAEPVPTYVIREPTFPPSLQPALPLSETEVQRVSLEATMTAWAAGAAIIVDVREPDAYTGRHIAGAINIPLGDIELNPTGLSPDQNQWIITYCA